MASCQIATCLQAPAKLNLGLRIVGRRADGYHELESLFWPISFHDELLIKEGSGEFSARWGDQALWPEQTLPPAQENLVAKVLAAKLTPVSWDVTLTKIIPMGAGLGGGSSDAGTLLRYLIGRSPEVRGAAETLAVSLGADVPFFLDPRPAWITGIGERREYLSLAPPVLAQLHFLLVLLPTPLPTKAVFDTFRQNGTPFSKRTSSNPVKEERSLFHYLEGARNDLEDAASQTCPLVKLVLDRLRSEPLLHAALTGSGSTCFAIYRTQTEREKSIKVLKPFFRENFCKSITAETYNAS